MGEDELSDERIAEDVGIGRATLARWEAHPDFKAHVAEVERELDAAVARLQIDKRRGRMEGYEDRRNRLLWIVDERAAWFAENEPDTPGGQSGYLSRVEKVIGTGERATHVIEYAPDVALSRELRTLEQQAAQERGQWVNKGEISGPNGRGLIQITEIVIDRSAAERPHRGEAEDDGDIIDAEYAERPAGTPMEASAVVRDSPLGDPIMAEQRARMDAEAARTRADREAAKRAQEQRGDLAQRPPSWV